MIKRIYLAGGCFWGVEKYISLIPGVTSTKVGYANGDTNQPTYEDVCRRNTGHAETVEVEYDDDILNLLELLDRYYEIIDPTSYNRQGHDVGMQYRTGVYWVDDEDAAVVKTSLHLLRERVKQPLAVEAMQLAGFHPAEDYHQAYLNKNHQGYCHIPSALFEKARRTAKRS